MKAIIEARRINELNYSEFGGRYMHSKRRAVLQTTAIRFATLEAYSVALVNATTVTVK